ncbi:hypothetical protein LIER_06216 [Lithospermum erythrorhizon]|uniref:Uncharacterized protein n=1 Tax=Lithospermum erythrorhizon TaxID=34254 RepID=A0AAV3P511_LITER
MREGVWQTVCLTFGPLKQEAKGLPIPSAEDMDLVGKLRGALPQGVNKRPWYIFCDEAILVVVGLVYDKVFSSQDKGKPPTWDEISNIVASAEPELVDLDDMLMDRPSLFTRSQAHEVHPTARVVDTPANVVTLDSSTTISDRGVERQRETDTDRLSLQQELNIPFPTPIQQTALKEKAVNGAFLLVRRANHLALDDNSLRYKVEGMKKTIAFKNNLNNGLDNECKDQKAKLEEEAKQKETFRVCNDELERAKADEANKASEVLAQAKRDDEVALTSTAAKADTARIQFANSTLRSFLSSPAYEKKVGS